jgi:hypothetical protein
MYRLTISGSNGELITAGHPDHLLPTKGSTQQIDSQALLVIPNTQLPTLIATKGQQTASL